MDPDPKLTRPAAQQKMVAYLSDTVGALPAGTTLTRRSPVDPSVELDAGLTVPCDDSNTADNSLVDFSVRYWVSGILSGESERIFEAIIRNWEDRGWSTTETNDDPRTVAAVLPDSYALIAVGGALVTVSGRSPCFPAPLVPDDPDAPLTIEHP